MSSPIEKGKPVAQHSEPAQAAGRWSDGIAIVGMSARFPRSRNVQEFWEHLRAGESLISEYSTEELRQAGVSEATLSNSDYVRRGTALEDADSMDAEFFGLSRREAEITDPQQRVFLECAWEALEHSGYTGDGERVGVFAGVGMNTYFLQLLTNPAVMENVGGYQLMLANDKDFLATRAAYKLNLHGPAVVVQTACSTSLAAVHLACRSILDGECEMALAGGVSIPFPQGVGYPYIPGMILSPDGYCRPFDADARGTVPGRGAGVVILKRLSQALPDEDEIYAVIRGSAWNNDGAGKIGYTAPSIDGQAAVIRQALAAAGTTADRIGYVEAHGTGTELGDPIEVAALNTVFAERNVQPQSCVLGALKANLGHADVAAGVAGLIKAALAVQAGVIPPTLNFHRASPSLGLESGPFVVSSSSAPWPRPGERWAGVSSFGIGGTNVHVVISNAPERAVHPVVSRQRIFPVSARTPSALAGACDRLAHRLESDPSLAAEDVAATLQFGRREFSHRRAVVAEGCAELAATLREGSKKREITAVDLARDVVFLFPGQGQQFVGMADALYRADSAFRSTIDLGNEILRAEFNLNAAAWITGGDSSSQPTAQPADTAVAQPTLFLVEYALAARWRSLGVEPSVLVGHSLGELTAAAVAGVFSFEDGLRLAAERGRLMARSPIGAMLAVMLPPEKLVDYFEQDVWLAAENGPGVSVASGLVEAIARLELRLAGDRVAHKRLASGNAFHTPLMADAARAFRETVDTAPRQAPSLPWLSNVTGTWIGASEAQSSQYWGNQILARVRFTQNLSSLAERKRFLLEVGPGDALIGMAGKQMPTSIRMPSLGAEHRRASDQKIFLDAAARAWECGVSISWEALQPGERRRRVALPTYPFERQRYWIDPATSAQAKAAETVPERVLSPASQDAAATAKRADIASWFYAPSWQSTPPAAVALPQTGNAVNCWLVLLDGSGIGEALAARLSETGATIVGVSAADQFTRSGNRFTVNPARPSDYEELWQGIADLALPPEGLLNFWTMRSTKVQAYDSLLYLLQAGWKHRQRLRQIEIVTDRLESVSDEAIEEVERAEVLGLLRVLPMEYAGTQCRSIDVPLSTGNTNQIAEQLLEEVRAPGPGLTVAYRGETRWQKSWMPAPLRESAESPFRREGTYLITGGIGGIGYSVARHLLQQYQARVVLTGRTALPPRSDWAAWIAEHASDEPVTRSIRRMQELERSGGEVRLIAADVTNADAMTKVVAGVRQEFGRIHGVLHAAGRPGGSRISSQDPTEAANVRRAKIQGSIVLAELLRGEDLDFFALCSSISAVVPAPTQSAYAAANIFQNYFAYYCRRTFKLPAIAIGFDAWQEVGMAAEMVLPDGFQSVKRQRLETAMNTEEGIEVLRRVLSGWCGAQILCTTVSLDAVLAQAASQPSPVEREAVLVDGPGEELAAVLEIWKDLLAAEDIAPTDNFFELGGHSLMGTMVATRIRDRFGVELTLRTLFEAPTPRAVAEVIRASREGNAVPVAIPGHGSEREEFEI
ncbi:MAG TPA: SDR family NAD(P)-dependent oxidoreductase [Acidobacteriaceae bacterium]|jgi:acyl transferase domain-containing protein/acyl carrier protein|nr:SDR family NAD(P)-dependent oxidoreductase [Acidobacteriaceae bacterium]